MKNHQQLIQRFREKFAKKHTFKYTASSIGEPVLTIKFFLKDNIVIDDLEAHLIEEVERVEKEISKKIEEHKIKEKDEWKWDFAYVNMKNEIIENILNSLKQK